MRIKLLTAALILSLAALVFGAFFAFAPRSGATQQAHTHRKGPRVMPQHSNRVDYLVLSNLRFTNDTDKATILFDVTNLSQRPVLAFTVRAGTYSITPHGTLEQPALAPGETQTYSIATDNIADESQLVLSAMRFADGDEHGDASDLRLIRKTLVRQH